MAGRGRRGGGRSVRLTRRGVAFLVLGVAAIAVAYAQGNRFFLLVGLLLASLVLLAAGLARFRSMRLEVGREFTPSPVAAGTPTRVTLQARNLSAVRSALLYWNDALPWPPGSTASARLDPLAPASARTGRVTRLGYTVVPPRRGLYEVGPLQVAYGDPFGLALGFAAIGGRSPLTVVPAVTALSATGVWLEAPDGNARLVQVTSTGNADDLMTREYRRGDALRRVHWRATARQGELMVRQEEERTYPEATILVDTRRSGYPDAQADARGVAVSDGFEWVVSMLASLGTHLQRAGFAVHVAENAAQQVVPLTDDGARTAREAEFLVGLAGVTLQDAHGEPPVTPPAEGPVFALLAEPDAQSLDWLLRHRRPHEPGAAFVVGASRHVVTRLRDAGWSVVPVDPSTNPAFAWSVLVEDLGVLRARG